MGKIEKLLIVHTCLFSPGGAERQIVWLARELSRRGINLQIIASDFGEWALNDFQQMQAEVKTLQLSNPLSNLAGFRLRFNGLRPLIETVPDRTLKQGQQKAILQEMGLQVYESAAGFDAVVAFGFPSYIWLYLAQQRGEIPPSAWFCFEPPGMFYRDKIFPHFHSKPAECSPAALELERKAACFPRLAMTTSNHIKEICRQVYARDDFIPLYAGLPEPFIDFTPPPYDFSYIFSAGRLYPEKNYYNLIRGYAGTNSPEKLVIGGDGPEKPRLEQLVEELGLKEKVILAGRLSEYQLNQHYQHCRMVVFPALDEPLGLIPIEAGFYKKASLVSDQGGPKETIINNGTALWFNPLDPQDMALSIEEMLKNPERLQNMGEKAYEYCRSNYTIEAFTDRFLEAIKTII